MEKDKYEHDKASAKRALGFMTVQQLLDTKEDLSAYEFEIEASRVLGENLPKQRDYTSMVQALMDMAQKQKELGKNALRPRES